MTYHPMNKGKDLKQIWLFMAKVADGGKCEPVRQEDEIDYVEWVDMEEAKRRVTEWDVGVLERVRRVMGECMGVGEVYS